MKPVLRLVLGFLLAVFFITGAAADWSISSHRDRLADKDLKIATLPAKSTDRGVSARLTIRCLDHELVGGLILSIDTSARFSHGRMGLRYRIDQGEPTPRHMPVDSSGNGMSLWADPEELRGARRIKVELHPAGSGPLLFDFDLTGTDRVFSSIPCKKTRQ